MKQINLKLTAITAATALSLTFLAQTNPAQAATYDLSWKGEGGYSLTGSFAFDDQFLGTTVTRDQLSSLTLSFFNPNGVFLQGFNYSFPQTGEFNFNFDTITGTVLQSDFANLAAGFDIGIDNSSGLEAGIDFYTCFDASGSCFLTPQFPSFQGILLQQNDVPSACFDPNAPTCIQLDKGGVLTANRRDIPEPTSVTTLVLLGLAGLFMKRKSLPWSAVKLVNKA